MRSGGTSGHLLFLVFMLFFSVLICFQALGAPASLPAPTRSLQVFKSRSKSESPEQLSKGVMLGGRVLEAA